MRTGGVTRENCDLPFYPAGLLPHNEFCVCGSVLESVFQGLGRGDNRHLAALSMTAQNHSMTTLSAGKCKTKTKSLSIECL